MSDVQTLFVTRVQLFFFREDLHAYEERGTVGCCVMGSPATQLYKLGCYTDNGEYICTVTITANNETGARIALQGNGYVSFKDEQGRPWSLQLPTDAEAIEFVAHVAVAMYSAAGSPEASIIACDAATGKKDRPIFANDKVKVRYQSWVVQRGAPGRESSKLGSALESNAADEKPYVLTVPANHVSVTADMKGFEGMLVGACEESQRFIVIPQSARRGSGPNSHMCYFVNILKKKDESKPGTNMTGQPNAIQGGAGTIPSGQFSSQVVVASPQQYHQVALPYGGGGDAQLSSPAPPTVLAPAPPPPPPGFNGEQLMIVDRMRDQIQVLTQQLKEATQKLDLFAHDFKVHEQKVKPTSLASAQLEYTIQKMIQDTEDVREELHQRDITLKQVEERNRELQRKVDRFTATANQLADEKKSAISVGSEEKIDLDRRIAQLQAQLTRIQGEREDVARHLSTTKRLLEISDQDLKGEKGKFQIALVTFQTNESKLAACEETLVEERSRRKVLESKCAVLGDELRSLSDTLRVKDGQMDERRRKMEADKLHYTQLMEDERSQAASELRELRQELIDELAIRERRYQEERQRVAHESFERGRVQGVDDGHADALLEADQRIQELVLSVGRSKSEVETMKIRLRQCREHADADQRRLKAQISALQRTVDDLDAQNSATDLEMDSLRSARTTVESDAFDRIASAIRELSRPIGKSDLLSVIHALRVHKPLDLSFEVARDREEEERLAEERSEVSQWVRGSLLQLRAASESSVDSRQAAAFPRMRTRAAEQKLLPYVGDIAPSTAAAQVTELPEEVLAMIAKDEARRAEEALKFDPEAMNKRYMELLTQMNDEHPELGLVEKKAPPPPPQRPPTPPREPTPAQQQQQQQQTPAAEVATPLAPADESIVIREPSPPRDDNTPVDDASRDGAAVAAPCESTVAPSPAIAQQQPPQHQQQHPARIADSDDDSDDARVPSVVLKSPVPQPPVQEVVKPSRGFAGVRRSSSSESDADGDARRNSRRRVASPPQSQARKQPTAAVVAAESTDDEPAIAGNRANGKQQAPPPQSQQQPQQRAAAPVENEGRGGASPRGASQSSNKPAPNAKRSAMFQSSDEDDDEPRGSPAAAASKPVAPPKRAAPQQRAASKFADSEDSDAAPGPAASSIATASSGGGAKPVAKPAAKASAAAAQKKKSMFADSDDSDAAGPPPPKKSAPASSAAKKPLPKKKSMFDSDDD